MKRSLVVEEVPQQCVILAGGRGSRLGKLTDNAPKPLLQVSGRPFLDHLIDRCLNFGFKRILILAGYKAELINAWAGSYDSTGINITVVSEEAPLGTAGALFEAKHLLDNAFLLLNGDSLIDMNWVAFSAFARGEPTIAVRQTNDLARYGEVTLCGDRVISFSEKKLEDRTGYMNCGLYLLNRSILTEMCGDFSLETETFPRLAAAGRLRGIECSGPFIDIGTPASIEWADRHLGAWGPRGLAIIDRSILLNCLKPDATSANLQYHALKLMADHGVTLCVIFSLQSNEYSFFPKIVSAVRNFGVSVRLITAQEGAKLRFDASHRNISAECCHMWVQPGSMKDQLSSLFQPHDISVFTPEQVRNAFGITHRKK